MASDDAVERNMAGCLLIFVALAVWPVWGGYALSLLWLWFVVPLGVSTIGIAHAVGLTMLVRMLAGARGGSGKDSTTLGDGITALATAVLAPAFGLFVGWVAKSCMG